jgi:hypothetical protein
VRKYPAWVAMSQRGADQLWPIGSSLPAILKDIGYSSPRLDRLYKNCSGPTPWPGAFADNETGATMTLGKLPPLATLTKLANDWSLDGKPGKIEIDGRADLNQSQPGNLTNDSYAWTLTICPLNKDGQPPPDCP